jgi:hypothetical protein
LADATRLAHSRISDILIRCWGGLDAGLPALFDLPGTGGIDGYGPRHLAEHLEAAGREEDLHRLLGLERRVGDEKARTARAENVWFAARERVGQTEGYMNDLARAARLVQIEPSQSKTCIGLGIRYALMSTSLISLARNIPPILIAALVQKGVWLASQGFACARALPSEQRVCAFNHIVNHIDDCEKETVVREALKVAQGIGDPWDRASALAALAPRLKELGRDGEALKRSRFGSTGLAPKRWPPWGR